MPLFVLWSSLMMATYVPAALREETAARSKALFLGGLALAAGVGAVSMLATEILVLLAE